MFQGKTKATWCRKARRWASPELPLVPASEAVRSTHAPRRPPFLFPLRVYSHSPLLELVWLGNGASSLLRTDDVLVFWVTEHTAHSPWLLLFYNVSNLQILECLPLTLSGSLSYFRVNKSCFRHCTEHIQFVFVKNSTWKMGNGVLIKRVGSRASLPATLSQLHHSLTAWPWTSYCTSWSLLFPICKIWVTVVPTS